MLRYTAETLSKYWDDEDYRIFTFKMNAQGKLIILSSNATNCNLYGFSNQSIGKTLYEVMEREHAERWHNRFGEWKKRGLISYVAHFDDNNVGWNTTIEIIGDTLFGIGKKIASDSLNQLPFADQELFNHYVIQPEDFMIISLSVNLENNSFIIDSVDSSYDTNFDNFIGKDVSSITSISSNILDKKVYKKCIQKNRVIHFAEKLDQNATTIYWDVHLHPYQKTSKILLHAKAITEQQYKIIQKNLCNMYASYPESDQLAICEVCFNVVAPSYIIGCNTYFKQLLHETTLKFSDIINNFAFQSCIKSFSTETAKIVLKNNLDELINYKINVTHMPEIQNNIYMVVLLPEEESTSLSDASFSALSAREKEIITYVANGLTNRYVANKLNISEGTVKKTLYNSYKKLGITSRVELVRLLKNEIPS